MKSNILKKLECYNDSDFKFDPLVHKYTYHGDQFISVTKFITQFHKPFEQNYWSQRKAEESGVPQEWILNEWKKSNDYANEVGTETHNWIEDYFNGVWRKLPNSQDIINRINKFNIIYADQLHKLEPLKFELRIFSKRWKIAGTIDILDWKTNKLFTTDENIKYPEKLLHPFSEFNKTHLNEYSIQISLYALILKEWGFDVAGGYLVHIGPGDEPAKMYKCVDMSNILKDYLDGCSTET
jgi:ATP-dependent exoDNAse (exonuclease V) beta subunit